MSMRLMGLGLVSGLFLCTAEPARADGPPPVEAFAALPDIRDAQLSPDGRYLAVVRQGEARSGVFLYEIADGQGSRPAVVAPEDARVTGIAWAAPGRVLIQAEQAGALSRLGGATILHQIISVRADGSDPVILQNRIEGLAGRDGEGPSTDQALVALLPDREGAVLISGRDQDGTVSLYTADLESGAARLIERGRRDPRGRTLTVRWLSTPDGENLVRWNVEGIGAEARMEIETRLRGKDWSEIVRHGVSERPPFTILGFAPGEGRLFTVAPDEDGRPALHLYDIAARTLTLSPDDPGTGAVTGIAADPRTGVLLQVETVADRRVSVPIDGTLAALRARIDRSFAPDRDNRILSSTQGYLYHVVESGGPSVPTTTYLFDSRANEARRIGMAYPDLGPGPHAPVEALSFQSRDGLALRAYVTRPKRPGGEADAPPLVVLVHNGPAMGLLPALGDAARDSRPEGFGTLTPGTQTGRTPRALRRGEAIDDIRLNWLRTPNFRDVLLNRTFGGRPVPPAQDLSPHGGAERRAVMAFHYLAQFLASRGYAVLQPNYRGSEGLTRSIQAAGDGEWGLAMQADLFDAVAEVGARGIADVSKVCFAGQGYGGYAALMALAGAGAADAAAVPTCAIAVAPLTDLGAAIAEADGPSAAAYWARALGPGWTDGPARTRRSPVSRAGAMVGPVLLIHAEDDPVVPFAQSEAMAAALKAAGKPVTVVALEGTGHGLQREADRARALTAMEAVLADAF